MRLFFGIFDEWENILNLMYSTTFNGVSTRVGTSLETQQTPETVTPSLIITMESGLPDKFRKRKKGNRILTSLQWEFDPYVKSNIL